MGIVHGFPVGILANNGVLFSESSQKAAQFIQLCNQIDTPARCSSRTSPATWWARQYEQGGIIKHGRR